MSNLEHPVSPTYSAIAPPFPCCPGSPILIVGHLLTEMQAHHGTGMGSTRGRWCRFRVTIDVLPDVALLRIFDLYLDIEDQIEAWHKLVHVCRKWRIIVFGSACRLNLRLLCTARTPVRETLDIWPLLPIDVRGVDHEKWGVDNIIAALEHSDRICEFDLSHFDSGFTKSEWKKVLAAMRQPFPALTCLSIWRYTGETMPVVPASFLGGSAPCLQSIELRGTPFPGLPNLLLSATRLVSLQLSDIPYSGYFSPESLVTSLSVLTRLKNLHIAFKSPRNRPSQRSRSPLPLTHVLLPILKNLRFIGVSDYLEELVARIDAPLLYDMDITFFHQLVFDTPQLTQFISRTPKFKPRDEARLVFDSWLWRDAWVSLPQTSGKKLRLGVDSKPSKHLSSLAQICSLSFPQAFISAVEHLYIFRTDPELGLDSENDIRIDDSHWLDIFRPFTAVRSLYISEEYVPHIAPALQEIVEDTATEVMPTLKALFLEGTLLSGPVQEAIVQFVASRQLSGNPIAVFCWRYDCVVKVYKDEYS